MLATLTSLLGVTVIALAAYGLGRAVLVGLGLDRLDRLAHAVWSIALGLIVSGMLLTGLGLVGKLYVPLIGALSLAGCFWSVGKICLDRGRRESCRVSRQDAYQEPSSAPWPAPPGWLRWPVVGLAALACVGSLIVALAPPTAGDALCYHLELPKVFLADHGLTYLPDHVNSTFPALVEMWYLWGLALDGPVAAGLIHWGLGVLLALATVVLATPILGRPWACMAGALVVLVPGVNNQMTAPLCDVALTLLTTLTLAAWWQAIFTDSDVDVDAETGIDTDATRHRWFLVAGLAAGGALGTKYLALVFGAAVAGHAAWLFMRDRARRPLLIRGAAIVAIVAISVGGIWYVRAAWYRGNPVYPFLSEVFIPTPVPENSRTLPPDKSPLGRGLLGLTTAPWQVTMHPERFGGRGHQLGIVFLAAIPGVLIVRRLHGLGMLAVVAGLYALGWFLLRQNVRFLLPAVPPAAVAVVWVWIEMRRLPNSARRLAAGAFATSLAAFATVAISRSPDCAAVVLGLESRSQYLTRHEPTWQAAEVSNQFFGLDAHLLSQDYRAFYFDCKVTRENLYRQRTAYDRQLDRPAELSQHLRERGFTHLLLAENVGTSGIRYDPTLRRLVEAQWAVNDDQSLIQLAEYNFTDIDGANRRYRLVLLQ